MRKAFLNHIHMHFMAAAALALAASACGSDSTGPSSPFRAGTPGTYYYRASTSGSDIDRQRFENQLAGALVVDPPGAPTDDRIFVIGAWFRPDSSRPVGGLPQSGMVINGRSWPHTERLTYWQDDSVRWRWINASGVAHPMHLHGFYFHVESRGDWRSERVHRGEERPFIVTSPMQPGETMRIGWLPERAGNWIFHCHFAFHVSHHLKLAPPTRRLPVGQAPAPLRHLPRVQYLHGSHCVDKNDH